MDKAKFLTDFTATLTLSATASQSQTLDAWTGEWLPKLAADAKSLFTGPFAWQEIGMFSETAVLAAQQLKGVFAGTQRAEVAQAILVSALRAALPDKYEHWVLVLMQAPMVAGLIEAAFKRLEAQGTLATPSAPVVDAPELPEGGVK